MGLQLPGELTSLLSLLGYTWPEADEEKLFQLGSLWTDFGAELTGFEQDATVVARRVWQDNAGIAVAAFQAAWDEPDAGAAVLRDGAQGAQVIGVCAMVCAGVVLALKIAVIVQLVILAIQVAQAIAAAAATGGASLLIIPVAKKITGMIIDLLIDQAIGMILGG